jgi:hypothetical protein
VAAGGGAGAAGEEEETRWGDLFMIPPQPSAPLGIGFVRDLPRFQRVSGK